MIYLITGVPGSGKTLYALAKLVPEMMKGGERRLLVDGVPELTIPHELMAPVREGERGELVSDGDSVLTWWQWARPGDVLLVDEVQRYWRPRGMGVKAPEMIQRLETHRHQGVDFVLITQSPMLIDQNVRRLVGRHIHVRRVLGMGRTVLYDWDSCAADVTRTRTATMSYWPYDKRAFSVYRSSELHTKQRQRIPAWVILPVLAVVGAVFVGPKAFSVLYGSATGKGVTGGVAVVPGAVQKAASGPVAGAPSHVVDERTKWIPRVGSMPESAPVYDDIRKVSVFPLVVGGYCQGPTCVCVTQQGTNAGLSSGDCRAWLASPRFNPYRLSVPSAGSGVSGSAASAS